MGGKTFQMLQAYTKNVRTIRKDGYPELLVNSLSKHNIDVAVLSETRLTGTGIIDLYDDQFQVRSFNEL